MREKWRKAPGGGVNLRIYAGGKMGGETKMVSQMRLGALDAALLTATGLADIEPAVTGLQSLPVFFRTLDEVSYVGTKLHPILEKRMEKVGLSCSSGATPGGCDFFRRNRCVRRKT